MISVTVQAVLRLKIAHLVYEVLDGRRWRWRMAGLAAPRQYEPVQLVTFLPPRACRNVDRSVHSGLVVSDIVDTS